MRPISQKEIAHTLWQMIIQPGDTVVDATAGNGHDSLFLASRALKNPQGRLIAIDVQQPALDNTRHLLKEFPENQITLINSCHSKIAEITDSKNIKLIVFNLGYLPGGDKSITTNLTTTITAIKASIDLIARGGLISIMCYPGHVEGSIEEAAIIDLLTQLDPRQWSITSHKFINRNKCPHLLLAQRM